MAESSFDSVVARPDVARPSAAVNGGPGMYDVDTFNMYRRGRRKLDAAFASKTKRFADGGGGTFAEEADLDLLLEGPLAEPPPEACPLGMSVADPARPSATFQSATKRTVPINPDWTSTWTAAEDGGAGGGGPPPAAPKQSFFFQSGRGPATKPPSVGEDGGVGGGGAAAANNAANNGAEDPRDFIALEDLPSMVDPRAAFVSVKETYVAERERE